MWNVVIDKLGISTNARKINTNKITILSKENKRVSIPLMSKSEVARQLLNNIAEI